MDSSKTTSFLRLSSSTIPEVHTAGLSRVPGNTHIPEHSISAYAINFLTHGEMTGTLNGTPLHLQPGIVYLFKPDDRTSATGLPEKGEIVCRWLSFTWPSRSKGESSAALLPREVPLGIESQERMKTILDELLNATNGGGAGWKLAALGKLLEALALTFNESVSARKDPSLSLAIDRRLRMSLAFMEQNFRRPIQNAEIAASAQLSKDHFKRVFRKAIGMPPLQYLIRLRIQEARRLLALDPALPVKEACRRAGFGSSKHFASLFRRHFNVTPRKFRESATPWSDVR
ncbi:MAG TPA: AraC family transcriptional regulator [Planctomycetota bacterium]|nr:AraC family transcriptional regulator [Planctomycetota bacterium]